MLWIIIADSGFFLNDCPAIFDVSWWWYFRIIEISFFRFWLVSYLCCRPDLFVPSAMMFWETPFHVLYSKRRELLSSSFEYLFHRHCYLLCIVCLFISLLDGPGMGTSNAEMGKTYPLQGWGWDCLPALLPCTEQLPVIKQACSPSASVEHINAHASSWSCVCWWYVDALTLEIHFSAVLGSHPKNL